MQHSQPYGEMAKAYCYKSLPLQVLQSAAGYYIGTADASGPVSRESTSGIFRRKPMDTIEQLIKPKGLDYYRSLTQETRCSVTFSQDEAAVILKAYDRGVKALSFQEAAIMDAVIAELKLAIHP